MKEQNNGQQENKIRKVLFNEVTAVVALVGLIIGFINWSTSPVKQIEVKINEMATQQALIQKDLATITNNHLAHIQELISMEDKRNDKQDITLDEIRDSVNEIKNSIIKINTILNQ